jgi:hypothetical protein
MAKDDEIERRLISWSRWRAGMSQGGLGFARIDPSTIAGDRGGYRESIIPSMDAEAAETDEVIQLLDSELRRTCEVVYLRGGSMEKKAAFLVCSPSALYLRVDKLHRQLKAMLIERYRARQVERARVEALTARAAKRPAAV